MIKTLGIISVGTLSISSVANLSTTTPVSEEHIVNQSNMGKCDKDKTKNQKNLYDFNKTKNQDNNYLNNLNDFHLSNYLNNWNQQYMTQSLVNYKGIIYVMAKGIKDGQNSLWVSKDNGLNFTKFKTSNISWEVAINRFSKFIKVANHLIILTNIIDRITDGEYGSAYYLDGESLQKIHHLNFGMKFDDITYNKNDHFYYATLEPFENDETSSHVSEIARTNDITKPFVAFIKNSSNLDAHWEGNCISQTDEFFIIWGYGQSGISIISKKDWSIKTILNQDGNSPHKYDEIMSVATTHDKIFLSIFNAENNVDDYEIWSTTPRKFNTLGWSYILKNLNARNSYYYTSKIITSGNNVVIYADYKDFNVLFSDDNGENFKGEILSSFKNGESGEIGKHHMGELFIANDVLYQEFFSVSENSSDRYNNIYKFSLSKIYWKPNLNNFFRTTSSSLSQGTLSGVHKENLYFNINQELQFLNNPDIDKYNFKDPYDSNNSNDKYGGETVKLSLPKDNKEATPYVIKIYFKNKFLASNYPYSDFKNGVVTIYIWVSKSSTILSGGINALDFYYEDINKIDNYKEFGLDIYLDSNSAKNFLYEIDPNDSPSGFIDAPLKVLENNNWKEDFNDIEDLTTGWLGRWINNQGNNFFGEDGLYSYLTIKPSGVLNYDGNDRNTVHNYLVNQLSNTIGLDNPIVLHFDIINSGGNDGWKCENFDTTKGSNMYKNIVLVHGGLN